MHCSLKFEKTFKILVILKLLEQTYGVKPCSCCAAAATAVSEAACCWPAADVGIAGVLAADATADATAEFAETMEPVDPVSPVLVVAAKAARFLCWAALSAATAFSG